MKNKNVCDVHLTWNTCSSTASMTLAWIQLDPEIELNAFSSISNTELGESFIAELREQ
jgi:hypothetical protein